MDRNKWQSIEKSVNKREVERVEKKYDTLSNPFTPDDGVLFQLAEDFIHSQENDSSSGREEELSKAEKELISLRYRNVAEAMRAFYSIENKRRGLSFLLREVEKKMRKGDKRTITTRSRFTDELRGALNRLEDEEKKRKETNPESYIVYHLSRFKENIKRSRSGGLIETPYVRATANWLEEHIRKGDPVFLHGHLGAGKTELAVQTARETALNRLIEEELEKRVSENTQLTVEEIGELHREIEEEYEKRLKEGDKELFDTINPFLVAGSKDFSVEDLYTEKTLSVTKLNGKTLQERVQEMRKAFEEWENEHRDELEGLSEDDRLEKVRQAHAEILEAYKIKNTAFGTEVKKIEKELTRALKEGKTVIIDEANAIPASVFISMNDILTKRPGDIAYVPGEGPVKVQEGFSIIMTGNLNNSSLDANYVGVEEMNPAFLSRLKIREYDYLPQNISGTLFEQKNPEKNELFYVLTSFFANKDGSLVMPEGGLEKLFALAQLAKETQNVFSGKWEQSHMQTGASGDFEKPKLETTVLSMRGIREVLQEWNKGQNKSFDMALWDGFISGITSPEDQKLIIQTAQRYGFFSSSDGWNISFGDEDGVAHLLSKEDVRSFEEKHQIPENVHYSPRKVVEILHGEAPERIIYPDVDPRALMEEDGKLSPEQVVEMAAELEQEYTLVGRYLAGLDVVEESCPMKEE